MTFPKTSNYPFPWQVLLLKLFFNENVLGENCERKERRKGVWRERGRKRRRRKAGEEGEQDRERRVNTKSTLLPSSAVSPSYICAALARWGQISTSHERFMLYSAGLSGAGNKSKVSGESIFSLKISTSPCAGVFFFYCYLYLLTHCEELLKLQPDSWWSDSSPEAKIQGHGPG